MNLATVIFGASTGIALIFFALGGLQPTIPYVFIAALAYIVAKSKKPAPKK